MPGAPSDETPAIADAQAGLSEAEVLERRARDGWNELPSGEERGLLRSILAVVREPMTLLVLACGVLYFAIGDRQEAFLLLGFVVFILLLTVAQERKTERALDSLRDLASPRALVIRDGRRLRVAGRDLVTDDVIVLSEGDRVPADAVVLDARHLAADESLVTGEAMPVRKSAWDGAREPQRPGGDDLPFVFAGTLVTSGSANARVRAIGTHTEIGRIGRALQTSGRQQTLVQAETRRLVFELAWIGGALSALAAIGYGLVTHDPLEGLLAGLTLAMAILPNEVPVVVTIFLALGAWRLSRRQVLARYIPAVESLGSVTVLCVDKTGTLTVNHMAVSRIAANGDVVDVDRSADRLPTSAQAAVEYGILASRRDAFDPMDRALKELGARCLGNTEYLHADWELVREYPLTPERLAVVRVWRAPDREGLVVAAKGAPEAIATLCRMSAGDRARMEAEVHALASEGLRVLGIARGAAGTGPLGDDPSAIALTWCGLVGLVDPLRESVPKAVEECRTAGIRVVMITGDYPSTARAIARRAGIDATNVVTGADLAAMSDDALRDRVKDTSVFARMLPEQKLRLVEALARGGEIVAMTGDGVNDAPALKAAHIGVAMGARGTDVAREAAGLVLLEDDFASLVHGVRLGRRIVDNLRKALAYILAVHLPIVGLTLVPIPFGWPLVLMPIHIAFLQLVIDPACTIVFEGQPEEADVMRRPPRDPRAPLFGARALTLSLLQGLSVLAVVLGVYAAALHLGETEADARGLTFATFIVANLALIFTNRSWSRVIAASPLRDRALWLVSGGALVFLALVLYVPPLARLFEFAPPSALDVVICAAAGLLGITWFELMKLFQWRRRPRGGRRHRKPAESR